jgi:transcriptional regulator with GAF, ATPase, and Fis domain
MTDTRSSTGGKGQPSTANAGTANLNQLAEDFGGLARNLEEHDDPDVMLAEIIAAAVAMVPGVDEGSVSVVTGRRNIGSQAPTGDLPVEVDALQEETQQGPCLDAAYEQLTVRVDDMASETRWPEFARRASQAGAASMLSLQLYVEGDNLGALNLYSRTPGAFDDESEQVGLLFASHAAVAYAGVRKEAQLAKAVVSRDLIGQAKGILMERFKVDDEAAFQMLVQSSQNTNMKLTAVAQWLTTDTTAQTARLDAPGEHR